jgi:hypothetical protein
MSARSAITGSAVAPVTRPSRATTATVPSVEAIRYVRNPKRLISGVAG